MAGRQILFWALLVGLFLEGTQLVLRLILGVFFHAVDITDVIMNAFGVLIGVGLYQALKQLVVNVKKKSAS
ncbi:MAG: hypothetical protein CVU39_15205 [Chloroflexi bacterium HGW-Chloroflexi-10]|nr:MAG: hypothetical protein CVU39_15205 [Chloroflexi bacterium HGW-Chloroflexi-10]